MSTVLDQTPTDCAALSTQMQETVQAILKVGLKPQPFRQQLVEILQIATTLPWLESLNRGAIFIASKSGDLILSVEQGLPEAIRQHYAKVSPGRGACGEAARDRRLVFRPKLDREANPCLGESLAAGHFNIPLLSGDGVVLGVMVLYVTQGHEPQPHEAPFLETLGSAVSQILVTQNLQMKSEINHIRFQRAQRDVTEKLVLASEYRDNETGAHIRRMSKYSRIIGQFAGLSDHQLDLLESAAPMHDIGKVGIPDSIMLKPGPLTDEEIAVMQTHPTIGAQMLQGDHELIQAGRDIALTHHEHWDGNGYPQGLQGIEIPLFGRICAIADVYDALTTSRPYKKAWSREEALDLIQSLSGTQFDPELVKAFMKGLWEILVVQARYSAGGEESSIKLLADSTGMENPLVTWNETMSVGHEVLDNQHQYLFDRINQVHQAVRKHDTRGIMKTLMEARTYATVHFREEEILMERCGYPELSTHRRLHEIFVEKLDQMAEEIQEFPLATTGDLILFLQDWILQHIQGVDAGYTDCINNTRDGTKIFD
jgi:hemerythrin-like metal-binding protein